MPAIPLAKLLVVDDEAPHMLALCQTLEPEGYSTVGFTSAGKALMAVQGGEFDLLLTDLNMPEMDGVSLLRAATAVDGNLISVIITGQGTISTAVSAMQAGAIDYILKPFKLSAVLPVLARALAIRRLRIENAELAMCVAERTRELEAANKELDSFSFSISHDLRAPLRAVQGFSRILAEDYSAQMPPEAQGLLTQVTASAGYMQQLIEDLLRLSRLGRQSLSKTQVMTADLVHEVLKELLREHADRQIAIHIGELPDCLGDAALLRQVFVNLLSNAIKFTRGKENAAIDVGCEHGDQEQLYFVRDNGAGFNMKYAGKLFGVFQRMHTQEAFDGTGIGLSIVQRIILRHGGRIWAEAEVGEGATFHFSLPMTSS